MSEDDDNMKKFLLVVLGAVLSSILAYGAACPAGPTLLNSGSLTACTLLYNGSTITLDNWGVASADTPTGDEYSSSQVYVFISSGAQVAVYFASGKPGQSSFDASDPGSYNFNLTVTYSLTDSLKVLNSVVLAGVNYDVNPNGPLNNTFSLQKYLCTSAICSGDLLSQSYISVVDVPGVMSSTTGGWTYPVST